eukprot:GDKJ01024615.1.p1 GENE.GDKJ01024615.1~~GDKJ01024615.1.p1  ORF type:complete len:278 (-),score=4.10 GDKJ01024615.1:181-1014(-)
MNTTLHMNTNKYSLVFFLCIALVSCNGRKTEYYSDGSVLKKYTVNDNDKMDGIYEEFFKNGKLKVKHIYNNGKLKDSSVYYDKNSGKIMQIDFHQKEDNSYIKIFTDYKAGKLSHEGNFNKHKKGKWRYYDKDGKLIKVIEYVDLCGTQYTNQGWSYDKAGNVIEKGSNYYTLKTKRSQFKTKEVINMDVHYQPILNRKSITFLCMSPKIKKDYCNLDKEKLDTLFSENDNFNFKLSFSKVGKKYIRGFIKEIYYDKKIDQTRERIIYIEIPFNIIK